MLITLIILSLFLFFIIGYKYSNYKSRKDFIKWADISELCVFGTVVFMVFSIIIITCIVAVNVEGVFFKNKYDVVKESISQISDYEYSANGIHEVIDINKHILNARTYRGNIWVNWFASKDIADLELISK